MRHLCHHSPWTCGEIYSYLRTAVFDRCQFAPRSALKSFFGALLHSGCIICSAPGQMRPWQAQSPTAGPPPAAKERGNAASRCSAPSTIIFAMGRTPLAKSWLTRSRTRATLGPCPRTSPGILSVLLPTGIGTGLARPYILEYFRSAHVNHLGVQSPVTLNPRANSRRIMRYHLHSSGRIIRLLPPWSWGKGRMETKHRPWRGAHILWRDDAQGHRAGRQAIAIDNHLFAHGCGLLHLRHIHRN